jgi:hypothetical protein
MRSSHGTPSLSSSTAPACAVVEVVCVALPSVISVALVTTPLLPPFFAMKLSMASLASAASSGVASVDSRMERPMVNAVLFNTGSSSWLVDVVLPRDRHYPSL